MRKPGQRQGQKRDILCQDTDGQEIEPIAGWDDQSLHQEIFRRREADVITESHLQSEGHVQDYRPASPRLQILQQID